MAYAEFDQVQEILGRKGKPRSKKHEFAFTGLITCGACGGAVTASAKTKLIKSTGKYKTYIFYHCTKRKGECSDKHYTTVVDLEAMIEQELAKYHLEPEFRDWAVQILRENNQDESNKQNELIKENAQAEQKILKELDVLIDMRVGSHITEEQYTQKKAEKEAALLRIQEKKGQLQNDRYNWLEQLQEKLDFVVIALARFKSKDIYEQKDVCVNFGWNWTLIGNKLIIDKLEWFEAIKGYKNDVESKFDPLEPKKTFDLYGEKAALDLLRPIVCRLRDDAGTTNCRKKRIKRPNPP